MNIFRRLLKSQTGMTVAEMAVAGFIAAGAALGAATLMGKMGGSSKDADIVIERTQFASALNVYLNSGLGCTDLKTASTEANKSYATDTPMRINNWRWDGFKSFEAGTEMRYNKIVKITSTVNTNPGFPKIRMTFPDGSVKDLTKSILRMTVILSPIVKNKPGEVPKPEKKYEHTYDLPVLINSTSQVEVCGGDRTLAETCSALKGTVKTTPTGVKVCSLDNTCQTYGSYQTLNCYPMLKGKTCDVSKGVSQVNPVTGNLGCPTGSSAVATGADTWTVQVDCGKKCTADVNNTIGYYSCLKCN